MNVSASVWSPMMEMAIWRRAMGFLFVFVILNVRAAAGLPIVHTGARGTFQRVLTTGRTSTSIHTGDGESAACSRGSPRRRRRASSAV